MHAPEPTKLLQYQVARELAGINGRETGDQQSNLKQTKLAERQPLTAEFSVTTDSKMSAYLGLMLSFSNNVFIFKIKQLSTQNTNACYNI